MAVNDLPIDPIWNIVESSTGPWVRSATVRSRSVTATAMAPAAPRSISSPAYASSPATRSSRTCTARMRRTLDAWSCICARLSAQDPRRCRTNHLHCACMATAARLDTLSEIREKVLANERLDFDDGVALLESDDLTALGELADAARRLRGGTDEVYFVNNLYLNHTNVCRVKCKFCAFAVTGKQPAAYTWDIRSEEHTSELQSR